jgi:hypothetical protein
VVISGSLPWRSRPHFLLPFIVSAGQPSNHLAYQFLFFSLFHVEHFWLGSAAKDVPRETGAERQANTQSPLE